MKECPISSSQIAILKNEYGLTQIKLHRITTELTVAKTHEWANWKIEGSGEDARTVTSVVLANHEIETLIKMVCRNMEIEAVMKLYMDVMNEAWGRVADDKPSPYTGRCKCGAMFAECKCKEVE